MANRNAFIYLILLSLAIVKCCCYKVNRTRTKTPEERLLDNILTSYDRDARGVLKVSDTVTVTVNFMLLRIQRLDERSQAMLTTGLVITEWTDERLRWSQEKYWNISDVVVTADRIWLPELAIINGADDNVQDFEKIRVLIAHNGLVHWEPGGVFSTTCDIDISYFPFDTQECPIEIGAWAYTSSRMNLTNVASEMELQEFKLNGEWDIFKTTAEWKEVILPCCPHIRYSKVLFTIHMTRRFTFYIMNIILPCSLLSILILVVFCVPPDAGEKISAGISVLLAFTVFLLMLADNVPRTSLDIPVLVMYLTTTMALGTASVCLSVIVLNIHYKGGYTPMPACVRTLFLGHIAKFVFVKNDTTEIKSLLDEHCNRQAAMHQLDVVDEASTTSSNTQYSYPVITKGPTRIYKPQVAADKRRSDCAKEWRTLATVLDRLFFIIVLSIMFLSSLLILTSSLRREV
ncbi:DgyrCDS6450 [Dimorphilus gyrociliatus]|uniref:DgyrCDS6450 n=1 Tax=Dimorphilus gyrociliatus TaxID=2664684 RepID=A0A7I8VN35_9ANNE|nr:DgyrCDS6450 [Dimorphilus gyrociliatus]